MIWLHGAASDQHATRLTGAEVALTVTPRGEDLLELRAAQPLEPGAWTLALDYTGELDALNTTGAFKQTVGKRAYVYTQFEAIYARRVFPCIDEPDSKVPWKLTLDVPKEPVAVSNTPAKSETDERRRHEARTSSRRRKPLPSYLVAFGVGPFEIVDAGKTKSGAPVRIVTLAGRGADAAWAAKTTPRAPRSRRGLVRDPVPVREARHARRSR